MLYVKNLSPRVTEADLVALFVRYQRPEGPKIIFKLMTGRMKGQAFVTFPGGSHSCEASYTKLSLVFFYRSSVIVSSSNHLTAMGTRVAPTYANLFMADFEETFFYTHPTHPTVWVRFIDDIFMVWEHGPGELQKFLDHLNRVHNTIKFTSHSSQEKVNVLDTWVSTRTNPYFKPQLN